MNQIARIGFKYTVEALCRRTGKRVGLFEAHNLVPQQGISHILNTVFKQGVQVPTWYVGLYEGNFTPVGTETAATLPGAATECTAYTSTTRPAWVPGTVAGGLLDNAAAPAEFTGTANKTVYGGFIASAAGKGATTGTLVSVVRFPAPRLFDADTVLRITAGFTFTSV